MAHVIQGRWFWHKSKARMGLPIGPQLPHFSDIRPFVRWKSLCLTFCSCWVLGGGSSWLTGSFAWRLYCCTELSCVLFHSIHSIHCRSVWLHCCSYAASSTRVYESVSAITTQRRSAATACVKQFVTSHAQWRPPCRSTADDDSLWLTSGAADFDASWK